MSKNKKSVLILCKGDSLAIIDSVISSSVKLFLKDNYSFIGINKDFKELFLKNPNYNKAIIKIQRVMK